MEYRILAKPAKEMTMEELETPLELVEKESTVDQLAEEWSLMRR